MESRLQCERTPSALLLGGGNAADAREFQVFLENASEEDVEEALLCSKGTFVTHEETGKRGLVYSLKELRSADELATYNWYKSILASTAANAPGESLREERRGRAQFFDPTVLNCYGLHEWAMQYQPEGEPDPPSRLVRRMQRQAEWKREGDGKGRREKGESERRQDRD